MKKLIKSLCILTAMLIVCTVAFTACNSSANASKFDSVKGDTISSEKDWDAAINNLDAKIANKNFTMYVSAVETTEYAEAVIDATVKYDDKNMYLKASIKSKGAVKSEISFEIYSSEDKYYYKDLSDKWQKVDKTSATLSSLLSSYSSEMTSLMNAGFSVSSFRSFYKNSDGETIEYNSSLKGYYRENKVSDTTYTTYVFKIKDNLLTAYSTTYEVSGKNATKQVSSVVYEDFGKTKVSLPNV